MKGAISLAVIFLSVVGCLTLSLKPASTWQNARMACRNDGMDLVMIKDSATWNAVSTFISAQSVSEFWMGLQYNTETQKFYWVDCEELGTYHNWDTSGSKPEPNCMTNMEAIQPGCSSYGQDCVRVRNSIWKTHGCLNPYYAICENVDYNLPLECPETTTTFSTKMVTTERSTKVTNSIQTSHSGLIQTSRETSVQSSSDACVYMCTYVCPGNEPISTQRQETTTVPIAESLKIDKKKTGAYIRAHTSAYDGRLSSKVIGLTGAAIICFVVFIMVLIDATRIIGHFNMN